MQSVKCQPFWRGLDRLPANEQVKHWGVWRQVPHNIKTLRPIQNGHHFPDDISNCMFLNENVWISIKISLKFVHKGQINNIPVLVQIMARHRPGDKPLYEPMMVSLLTPVCVTRPQWVNPWCPVTIKGLWTDNSNLVKNNFALLISILIIQPGYNFLNVRIA